MVQYQLPMGIQDAAHGGEGKIINKALGNSESTKVDSEFPRALLIIFPSSP